MGNLEGARRGVKTIGHTCASLQCSWIKNDLAAEQQRSKIAARPGRQPNEVRAAALAMAHHVAMVHP